MSSVWNNEGETRGWERGGKGETKGRGEGERDKRREMRDRMRKKGLGDDQREREWINEREDRGEGGGIRGKGGNERREDSKRRNGGME